MSENHHPENSNLSTKDENSAPERELIEKDTIPHFFPTYRVKRKFYPIPIIFVVILAAILAYLTYVEAGVQVDGGYIPESEFGPAAGLFNGIIFIGMAVISAFIIIFFVKRKGINVLKYIFGFSMALLCFFQTSFFGEIIRFLIFRSFPETALVIQLYYLSEYIMLIIVGILSIFILYKYFTSQSILTKNVIILYISLLTGALLGIIMPLWTFLAILIGLALWDIYAVLTKRGPIRQMIDLASEDKDDKIEEKIKSGELEYDTSKIEIGIGDLAFYSMLTSGALIITGSLIVMIVSAIAILIGTGITIQGLKKNKLLPGLPISIFLGLIAMFISWLIVFLLG